MDLSMAKVVVIGGGAGGMLAAGRAVENGAKVVLIEKNGILGKKLRITGKGRCNLTNTAEMSDFIAAFGANGKFLYSAFSRFHAQDIRDLLEGLGVPTKVERGGRVFPVSDDANEVADALERWLKKLRVDVRKGAKAERIVTSEHSTSIRRGGQRSTSNQQESAPTIDHQPSTIPSVLGVKVFSGIVPADAVILATGGITYPKTGSTGEGYRMAAEVGHTIITPVPSLSALETTESWVSALQGLSLKNVQATLYAGEKKVAEEFGEMLFTHFGVSGPIILSLSKVYAELKKKSDVALAINLKPALSREQLDARLIEDFRQTKMYKNYLPELLPRTLIPVFAALSRVPEETPVNRITAVQRTRMIDMLLGLRLTIAGQRSVDEAIVTSGGIPINQVNPSTMESKLVSGLYLAGEMIDIDAVTGGYNLQAAFSTGWVAGESAST